MSNPNLIDKVKNLPLSPGVYFYKDETGQIIYIGKAKKLKSRVKQYFQDLDSKDPKTRALIEHINDLEFVEVDSELEAIFLEAEMIRRYLPKYNILLRDDKSLSYIRIDYDSLHPTVTMTRRPLDDGARYFGPYINANEIKYALKYLRRIFPYAIQKHQKRVTLDYFLGLDPGLEENKTSLETYRANLKKLIMVIEGKQSKIENDLKKQLIVLSKKQLYEQAAQVRNQLLALEKLPQQVMLSSRQFNDLKKDDSIQQLMDLLGLKNVLKRIEGYDISHMSGTNVVASMVVFRNGVSSKTDYRKFKTKLEHNNDFYNMHETIFRRFQSKNLKAWGQPDLVLIDGGKGQLDAAIEARNATQNFQVPFIGLAKKNEQIVIQLKRSDHQPASLINVSLDYIKKHQITWEESDNFLLLNVDKNNSLIKLLQRIRDESHRFAVSYHTTLKRKNSLQSILDQISGIGPQTKNKLLKKYGSLNQIKSAPISELELLIGKAKTDLLKNFL